MAIILALVLAAGCKETAAPTDADLKKAAKLFRRRLVDMALVVAVNATYGIACEVTGMPLGKPPMRERNFDITRPGWTRLTESANSYARSAALVLLNSLRPAEAGVIGYKLVPIILSTFIALLGRSVAAKGVDVTSYATCRQNALSWFQRRGIDGMALLASADRRIAQFWRVAADDALHAGNSAGPVAARAKRRILHTPAPPADGAGSVPAAMDADGDDDARNDDGDEARGDDGGVDVASDDADRAFQIWQSYIDNVDGLYINAVDDMGGCSVRELAGVALNLAPHVNIPYHLLAGQSTPSTVRAAMMSAADDARFEVTATHVITVNPHDGARPERPSALVGLKNQRVVASLDVAASHSPYSVYVSAPHRLILGVSWGNNVVDVSGLTSLSMLACNKRYSLGLVGLDDTAASGSATGVSMPALDALAAAASQASAAAGDAHLEWIHAFGIIPFAGFSELESLISVLQTRTSSFSLGVCGGFPVHQMQATLRVALARGPPRTPLSAAAAGNRTGFSSLPHLGTNVGHISSRVSQASVVVRDLERSSTLFPPYSHICVCGKCAAGTSARWCTAGVASDRLAPVGFANNCHGYVEDGVYRCKECENALLRASRFNARQCARTSSSSGARGAAGGDAAAPHAASRSRADDSSDDEVGGVVSDTRGAAATPGAAQSARSRICGGGESMGSSSLALTPLPAARFGSAGGWADDDNLTLDRAKAYLGQQARTLVELRKRAADAEAELERRGAEHGLLSNFSEAESAGIAVALRAPGVHEYLDEQLRAREATDASCDSDDSASASPRPWFSSAAAEYLRFAMHCIALRHATGKSYDRAAWPPAVIALALDWQLKDAAVTRAIGASFKLPAASTLKRFVALPRLDGRVTDHALAAVLYAFARHPNACADNMIALIDEVYLTREIGVDNAGRIVGAAHDDTLCMQGGAARKRGLGGAHGSRQEAALARASAPSSAPSDDKPQGTLYGCTVVLVCPASKARFPLSIMTLKAMSATTIDVLINRVLSSMSTIGVRVSGVYSDGGSHFRGLQSMVREASYRGAAQPTVNGVVVGTITVGGSVLLFVSDPTHAEKKLWCGLVATGSTLGAAQHILLRAGVRISIDHLHRLRCCTATAANISVKSEFDTPNNAEKMAVGNARACWRLLAGAALEHLQNEPFYSEEKPRRELFASAEYARLCLLFSSAVSSPLEIFLLPIAGVNESITAFGYRNRFREGGHAGKAYVSAGGAPGVLSDDVLSVLPHLRATGAAPPSLFSTHSLALTASQLPSPSVVAANSALSGKAKQTHAAAMAARQSRVTGVPAAVVPPAVAAAGAGADSDAVSSIADMTEAEVARHPILRLVEAVVPLLQHGFNARTEQQNLADTAKLQRVSALRSSNEAAARARSMASAAASAASAAASAASVTSMASVAAAAAAAGRGAAAAVDALSAAAAAGASAGSRPRASAPENAVDAATSDESIEDLRQYFLGVVAHIYFHVDCPNRNVSALMRFCHANSIPVVMDEVGFDEALTAALLGASGFNYLSITVDAAGCVAPVLLSAAAAAAARDAVSAEGRTTKAAAVPTTYPNVGPTKLDWTVARRACLRFMKSDRIENFFSCVRGGTIVKFSYGKVSAKDIRGRFGYAQAAYLYGSSAETTSLTSIELPSALPYYDRSGHQVAIKLLFARAPTVASALASAKLHRTTLIAVTAPSALFGKGIGQGQLMSPD